MSRSFKKNPYVSNNSKAYKKIGHRITRRRIKNMDVLPSKGTYNKCFESWYIRDYTDRWTKEDAIEHYYRWHDPSSVNYGYNWQPKPRYETLDSYLQYWAKCSLRK